jgi:hypothetical protein
MRFKQSDELFCSGVKWDEHTIWGPNPTIHNPNMKDRYRLKALSAFLRGFADGAGLSLPDAASHWESYASTLAYYKRRDLEEGGYASGFLCALSYYQFPIP